MKQIFVVVIALISFSSCSKEKKPENPKESNLIAYFKLDGNTFDHSKTKAHGVTDQQFVSDRIGNLNSSLKFSNGYFRSGIIPLNLRGQYTFSMWMKINAWDDGNALMELTENKQCNLNPQIWQNGGVMYLTTSSNSNNRIRIPQISNCNGWTHVLYTVNETITNLYINGVLTETKSMEWPNTQNVDLTLGNAGNQCFVSPGVQNPYKQPSRVTIDEVKIYNIILPNSEILKISGCGNQISPIKKI